MIPSEVFAALDRAIAAAAPEERPGLVVALAARVAQLGAGLSLVAKTVDARPAEDRLLTYARAGELLGTTENYVATLARQRRIPVVRLPGTEKAGRQREGKLVRIRRSALIAWAVRQEQEALDTSLSTVIRSNGDAERGDADQNGARPDAGRIRKAVGRSPDDGKSLGTRRRARHHARREANPVAGTAGSET